MRSDFSKVAHQLSGRQRPRTKTRQLPRDCEAAPARVKMSPKPRFGNVDYGLVRRFLGARVGLLWNTVFAELARALDGRATQAAAVRELVQRVVHTATSLRGDEVYVHCAYHGVVPLGQAYRDYYVHPATGRLLRNPQREFAAKQRQARQAQRTRALHARRRDLAPGRQLHCLDGIWYEVELASLAPPQYLTRPPRYAGEPLTFCRVLQAGAPRYWDAVTRQWYLPGDNYQLRELYGQSRVYGKSRRQLSRQELKQHGLTNSYKLAA